MLAATNVFAESVVIVNPMNDSKLDKETIAKMFLGKTKYFSNGDKVVAISPKEKGATKQAFNEVVLDKSSSQLNAYWSKIIFTGKGRPPKEYDSDDEVKQQVASNGNVIGIIDAKSVDNTVKVVLRF
ncbi:phosphate ABC transporter substrate-binding protein [Aliikangiella marina]|uniref:Phosphate ABC transporter substrate-binding protein n=2 Tax=Aliikangiella marina TaxID=1712262 RepID=A0A545TEK7_9GAMM|nr:phosphate ABC transporter substrate-binding protein [Aliikangiella marina]